MFLTKFYILETFYLRNPGERHIEGRSFAVTVILHLVKMLYIHFSRFMRLYESKKKQQQKKLRGIHVQSLISESQSFSTFIDGYSYTILIRSNLLLQLPLSAK